MQDWENGRAIFEEKQAADNGEEEARDKKISVEVQERSYGRKKSQGY
jgi:hypothetical protein